MMTPRRKSKDGREGVALLLALVFIVLLAALVTDFMYRIHVEATLVESSNSNHEALLAARSGVATAMSILHADRIGNSEETLEVDQAGMYDSLDEPWAEGGDVVSFNDDLVNMSIVDEYSKINLNALIFETSTASGDTGEAVHEILELVVRDVFMVDLELELDPTDVILDWLDADDIPRPNGAESDYYESLDPPFSCKNGPMDSIEELLLLPSITPEIFFGLPDPEEELELELEEDGEAAEPIPLSDLFTVHGHPEGRLNINTTSPGFIELMLEMSEGYRPGFLTLDMSAYESQMESEFPFFDTEQQLLEAGYLPKRQQPLGGGGAGNDNNPSNDNENTNDTNSNGGGEGIMPPPMFTVESNVFRIQADGQSGETGVRVEAYVFRDPSDKQGGESEPQLFRILDWRVVQ